ncbi:MAG: hypothetical protein ABSE42_23765 [Bryobacteraceae bacterium]|jgi:hypothetical protein
MTRRIFAALPLATFLLAAGPKKTTSTIKGENEDLILTATLYIDPQEIKQLVGSDLEGHFFVAEVRVEPKYGKEIAVDPDDFVLRTNKDGEHTQPFEASQVAGKNVMVITPAKGTQSGGGLQTGPTYGGMPVPVGGPMGYPSNGVGVGGGGSGEVDTNKATVQITTDEQDNPLEKALDQKMLPRKKTLEPVSGLLYFPMEKQKMKDLELRYGGQENRITLRFR